MIFRTKIVLSLFLILIICVVGYQLRSQEQPESLFENSRKNQGPPPSASGLPNVLKKEAATTEGTDALEPPESSNQAPEVLLLGSSNFQIYVLRCFQGEPCTFSEDPLTMFKDFIRIENREAADLLISFLRSKLQDSRWKDRYQKKLMRMIDEFYPESEKPFQMAAYYNYAGELEKSLELYLDLERRSKKDPASRPAPKLNIANTYYDLNRFKEALPYYEAARQEYLAGTQQSASPGNNEMVRFIEERIEIAKHKLKVN